MCHGYFREAEGTWQKIKKRRGGYQTAIASACLICLICLIGGLIFLNNRAEEENRIQTLDDMPVFFTDASTGATPELFSNEDFTAVVEVLAGGFQGTGVIWGSNTKGILILTAAHVLEKSEGLARVIFGNKLEAVTADIQIYEGIDLATLLISWEDVAEDQIENLHRVRIDKEQFDNLQPEDECLAVGIQTSKLEGYRGKVLEPWIFMEEYGQYMLWAKVEIKPGMSGGGLFDAQGNFLGILSGGSRDREAAVVPLSLILTELQFLNQE